MNIFNLTTPALYRCHIHRYYSVLSRLYVRVFKAEQQIPAFYLLFSDVGYIEGPVTWQGMNFRIAPVEECIALMLYSGLVGEAILQFPDAYAALTDHAKLYVVETGRAAVRIIASSAALLPDVPPEIQ